MNDNVEETIKELFMSHGTRRELKPGEHIWLKGYEADGLYYLEKGTIRVYFIYPDGTDRSFCFFGPGNLVGETFMLPERIRINYTSAETEVVMYHLNEQKLLDELQGNREAIKGLLRLFMRKLELLTNVAFYTQFRHNREKLACFLYHSSSAADDLYYTQQQIADITGMTRVSVSKHLREFAYKGLINTHYRAIKVINRQELREIFGDLNNEA